MPACSIVATWRVSSTLLQCAGGFDVEVLQQTRDMNKQRNTSAIARAKDKKIPGMSPRMCGKNLAILRHKLFIRLDKDFGLFVSLHALIIPRSPGATDVTKSHICPDDTLSCLDPACSIMYLVCEPGNFTPLLRQNISPAHTNVACVICARVYVRVQYMRTIMRLADEGFLCSRIAQPDSICF